MFNSIYVDVLATELPCTFLVVKTDRNCQPQIFVGNSPWYLIGRFNSFNWLCCLANEFAGFIWSLKMNGKPPYALQMVASLFWGFTSIFFNPLMQKP